MPEIRREEILDYETDQAARVCLRSLFGRYKPQGNIEEADCAVILPFGGRWEQHELFPGPCNEALAETTRRFFRATNTPLVVSYEIELALRDTGWLSSNRHIIDNYTIPPPAWDNLAELVLQAVEVIDSEQLGNKVAVITHPYRMPRATKLMEYALPDGSETIAPSGLRPTWDAGSWFDHAMDPFHARLFEAGAVIMDYCRGSLESGAAAA